MKKTTEVSDTNWEPRKWFAQRVLFLWVMLGLLLGVSTAVNSIPTYSVADVGVGPTTSSSMSAPGHALATLVAVPTAHDCAYPDDCTPGTTMPDSETTTTDTGTTSTDPTVPSGPVRLDCGTLNLTVTGSYTYSFESFSASPSACNEVLLPVDCASSAGWIRLGDDVFSSDRLPWTSSQAPLVALPGTYDLDVFCPTQHYLLTWLVDAA